MTHRDYRTHDTRPLPSDALIVSNPLSINTPSNQTQEGDILTLLERDILLVR